MKCIEILKQLVKSADNIVDALPKHTNHCNERGNNMKNIESFHGTSSEYQDYLLKEELKILDAIPYVDGRGRNEFIKVAKKELKKYGTVYQPSRTAGGTCLLCGEDGRCIGWHIAAFGGKND